MTDEAPAPTQDPARDRAEKAVGKIAAALSRLGAELEEIGVKPDHWHIKLDTHEAADAIRFELAPSAYVADPKRKEITIAGVSLEHLGPSIGQIGGALGEAEKQLALCRRALADAHGWVDRARQLTSGAP